MKTISADVILFNVPSTTAMEDIYDMYGLYDYMEETEDGQIYLHEWEKSGGIYRTHTHIWVKRTKPPEQEILWNQLVELKISPSYLDILGSLSKKFIADTRHHLSFIKDVSIRENWRYLRLSNTPSNMRLLKKHWHLFECQENIS